MIKINDTIIQADTEDMLKILKSELYQRGIDRFSVFRKNGDNIQTSCPFHKNGQEKKPSFGVNGNINKCHCFSCGWSGGINEMISELFGYMDGGKFGKRWLIKRFNTIEIEHRPNILEGYDERNISNNRNNTHYHRHSSNNTYDIIQDNRQVITEEELDSYRYTHPYMYERGLTDEIIEEFDIGYDKTRDCLTFPIKDINGDVVFIATRSTRAKFFGLPQGQDKPIYQGYRFTTEKYKEAYITESFLNCLTCWKYGKPAMAMIGTGNRKQYEILNKLPVRTYILAFDPDEAGRKATRRFKQNVRGKIIKEVIYEDSGKDINDLQEKIIELKTKFF